MSKGQASCTSEPSVDLPEAAIVVADIDPEPGIVLDNTPVMLEDMPVVLAPAAAMVEDIMLLITEDV